MEQVKAMRSKNLFPPRRIEIFNSGAKFSTFGVCIRVKLKAHTNTFKHTQTYTNQPLMKGKKVKYRWPPCTN
jgi:hypothetical protein